MSKQLLLEEFEEKFCDNGPIGEYDSIKNFISKAIDKTREDTIKEVEKRMPPFKNTENIQEERQLKYNEGFNSAISQVLNNLKQ